jgi:hypothetical protein
MGTELVPETLEHFNILTRLLARENFIEPAPLPLCPPQITHRLDLNDTNLKVLQIIQKLLAGFGALFKEQ